MSHPRKRESHETSDTQMLSPSRRVPATWFVTFTTARPNITASTAFQPMLMMNSHT